MKDLLQGMIFNVIGTIFSKPLKFSDYYFREQVTRSFFFALKEKNIKMGLREKVRHWLNIGREVYKNGTILKLETKDNKPILFFIQHYYFFATCIIPKYQVGDFVIIREDLTWNEEYLAEGVNGDEDSCYCCRDMVRYRGSAVEITEVLPQKNGVYYKIREDDEIYWWVDGMIEGHCNLS